MGTPGSRSRQCRTVRRYRQRRLCLCHAGGRGCAEERGQPRVEALARARLAVTWRIRGDCLCLFVSSGIEPRSNLNFLQSSDRQVKQPPRFSSPLWTREGDDGLISVRIQTRSYVLQRPYGDATIGATVCDDNLPHVHCMVQPFRRLWRCPYEARS